MNVGLLLAFAVTLTQLKGANSEAPEDIGVLRLGGQCYLNIASRLLILLQGLGAAEPGDAGDVQRRHRILPTLKERLSFSFKYYANFPPAEQHTYRIRKT